MGWQGDALDWNQVVEGRRMVSDGDVPGTAISRSNSKSYRLWQEPMLSPTRTQPYGFDSDVRVWYAQLDLYRDSDT